MHNQNDNCNHVSSNNRSMDSLIHHKIIEGLKAAKRYESIRVRIPPNIQEDMINEAFPTVPQGADTKQLTEDEYMNLRSSTHEVASQSVLKTIATLQEQLAEYHSVLERLETMTLQYHSLESQNQALSSNVQERNKRIMLLERELAQSRRNGKMPNNFNAIPEVGMNDYVRAQRNDQKDNWQYECGQGQFNEPSFDMRPSNSAFVNDNEGIEHPINIGNQGPRRVISHSCSSEDLPIENNRVYLPSPPPAPTRAYSDRMSGNKRPRINFEKSQQHQESEVASFTLSNLPKYHYSPIKLNSSVS